jgi:hypothetical protein
MSFIHPFHATHGTLRDNLSKHGEQNRKWCDGIDLSAKPGLIAPRSHSFWAHVRRPESPECGPCIGNLVNLPRVGSWMAAPGELRRTKRFAFESSAPARAQKSRSLSSLFMCTLQLLPSSDSLHRHCSSKPSSLSAMPSPSVCFCRCSLLTYWRKKEHLLQDKSAIP